MRVKKCVSVCNRERERGREREKDEESERERDFGFLAKNCHQNTKKYIFIFLKLNPEGLGLVLYQACRVVPGYTLLTIINEVKNGSYNCPNIRVSFK